MGRGSVRNLWLYPMLALGVAAALVTASLYALDHYLLAGAGGGPLDHFLDFDAEAVQSSIGVLSSIVAAVLGIIVTVVSIVVQLAATRYTPAISEMFFRDRGNRIVLGLYVIGCVMGLWIAFAVQTTWVPKVSLIAMLAMATLGFLVMAPYFAYVFRFLAPQAVVGRIEDEAVAAALGAAAVDPGDAAAIGGRRAAAIGRTEQLTDIAINAISQKDKIIATACVDALRDLALAYLGGKRGLPPAWSALGPEVRQNPDFASMAADSVDEVERAGTWFEFKVLRQYQAIYTEALGSMRDINYVVAINTRILAERAVAEGAPEALALAVKFFNTYLRATLNQNDVRTAYTILNQYRIVAEAVLRAGDGASALVVAGHIKYYGHLSYQKKLAFVTETVAYDLGALCEVAHAIGSPTLRPLLGCFLEADPVSSEGEVQEASLRGVRKAQLKLATYFLVVGAEDLARRVWDDMKHESAERLGSIRDELVAVESKDFWEVSDRGGNFDYLPPERKRALGIFFSWFGAAAVRSEKLSSRGPT